MALTVLPTSSLPGDPSWDEAIVPTLRKRLKQESQALSKRMSAASMSSIHDAYISDAFASNAAYRGGSNAASPTPQMSKPSAIPRPSLQHARTMETSNGSGASQRPTPGARSRTVSQPFPFDPSSSGRVSYSASDQVPRATSPMSSSTKSTRIPVSRSRTESTSSHRQPSVNGILAHGRADSRNGGYKMNGHALQPPSSDLWSLNEGQFTTVSSRSTLKTPISNATDLAHEPAPFSAASSRTGHEDDFALPRRSSESEERPFEHWYRGDVSRNGGVGELRVGRKQEMLAIAYYGHSLRNGSSRTALDFDAPSRSRSSSRGHENPYMRSNGRPRSGSLGVAPGHASIYIDNQAVQDDAMVFDEQPPTELDSDEEPYENNIDEYVEEDVAEGITYQREQGPSPPLSVERSDTPTTLVDVTKSSVFKSRIPTPTPRQISELSETPTPTQSPTLTATTDTSSLPTKNPKPISLASTPAPLPRANPGGAAKPARAKSPAAAKTKSKSKSPPMKAVVKKQKEEDRRSLSQYPEVDGEDIMHAIPTWTQPVPPSGNWDDVVLPAVARKKGLEGQYVQADGSPRPKRVSNTFEPAPGTFGYDYTKRRQQWTDRRPEEILMDEFGQRKDEIGTVPEEEPEQQRINKQLQPTSPLTPPQLTSRGRSPMRAESPAPFAHYAAPEVVPQIRVTRPSTETQQVEVATQEEPNSGCCKCVIM